ncbi:neurofilament heavy protein [Perilla frutescens var. frutescens]|nr:neurofilament heavy protein [Perilla frutescens var. frutescens]
MAERKGIDSPVSHPHEGAKSLNVIEGSKKENEGSSHNDRSRPHDEETHGTSDDIDKNTPIDEVKGPSVIQRVKEEVEAVVGAVLPKK